MERFYTREEFEKILIERLDLRQTNIKTRTVEFWRTQDKKHVAIPLLGEGLKRYPHYMAEDVADQIRRLDRSR